MHSNAGGAVPEGGVATGPVGVSRAAPCGTKIALPPSCLQLLWFHLPASYLPACSPCRDDLPQAGLANVTATFLNLLGFQVGPGRRCMQSHVLLCLLSAAVVLRRLQAGRSSSHLCHPPVQSVASALLARLCRPPISTSPH